MYRKKTNCVAAVEKFVVENEGNYIHDKSFFFFCIALWKRITELTDYKPCVIRSSGWHLNMYPFETKSLSYSFAKIKLGRNHIERIS